MAQENFTNCEYYELLLTANEEDIHQKRLKGIS